MERENLSMARAQSKTRCGVPLALLAASLGVSTVYYIHTLHTRLSVLAAEMEACAALTTAHWKGRRLESCADVGQRKPRGADQADGARIALRLRRRRGRGGPPGAGGAHAAVGKLLPKGAGGPGGLRGK